MDREPGFFLDASPANDQRNHGKGRARREQTDKARKDPKKYAQAHLDSILRIVRFGLTEQEVLNLPIDRFEAYAMSTRRIEAGERHDYVVDLVTAVGGVLTGKGIKEHIKLLSQEAQGE